MKNIKYVVWTAIVVWIFGSMFFADQISNWNINRRNKKIAEDGLQRLVDEYGLKIQNPIEDFGNMKPVLGLNLKLYIADSISFKIK